MGTPRVVVTDALGRKICPHCLHKRNAKNARRSARGGLRSLPVSFDLVREAVNGDLNKPAVDPISNEASRHIPIFAWLDPEPDRAILHLLVRGPLGGLQYVPLWLKDLQAILNYTSDTPALFTLSPDVRLLEIVGEGIVQRGYPRAWLKALRRGYVEPGKDMKRDRHGILGKL